MLASHLHFAGPNRLGVHLREVHTASPHRSTAKASRHISCHARPDYPEIRWSENARPMYTRPRILPEVKPRRHPGERAKAGCWDGTSAARTVNRRFESRVARFGPRPNRDVRRSFAVPVLSIQVQFAQDRVCQLNELKSYFLACSTFTRHVSLCSILTSPVD